ncbi:methylamine utilization protein [Pseudacidovorax intermedius]|uniref:methylamine utilization protein n=1 Tax=Pseudacidovorax intermedius TaxID=433924 RepID=UPI000346CF49|nr:methylamine utilization protein [Pseudacidovorax intermedius]
MPALAGLRRAARLLPLALLPLAGEAATVEVGVVDAAGRPLAQAVVFLESPAAAAQVRPLKDVEMAQAQRRFMPEVLLVTRGTSVDFPNRDEVRHHVYSFSPAKRFELKLYIGRPANPVLFDMPGVVVLGCNIHDDMVGWVLVLDTPHYGRTDAAGRLVLKDVPPGSYQLRTWHAMLPVGEPPAGTVLNVGREGVQARAQLPVGTAPP